MKLNIEELAKEAGFNSRHGFVRVQHSNGSFVLIDAELEAFARLLVERCAEECEAVSLQAVTAWKLAYQPVDQGREIGADECEHAIRNLLED